MKAQTNYLFVLVLVFLVSVGCSTGGLKERAELRTLISSANWDQAIDYVAKSDFYKTENVALLQAMELGLLYNSKGAYFQSTKMLNKAKEIHQKLFTVSISSAAKGVLAMKITTYTPGLLMNVHSFILFGTQSLSLVSQGRV